MIEANKSLTAARLEIQRLQKQVKDLKFHIECLGDPEGNLCGVNPGPERDALEQLMRELK
jgi:hypothetical protein